MRFHRRADVRHKTIPRRRSSHRVRPRRGDAIAQPTLILELLEDRRLLAGIANSIWQPISAAESIELPIANSSETGYQLDTTALRSLLGAAPREFTFGVPIEVSLPKPSGELTRFEIVESPVMAPELAAKFPEIRTYRGQGIDDRSASVRFSLTPAGFDAQIRSSTGTYYVDSSLGADFYTSRYPDSTSVEPFTEALFAEQPAAGAFAQLSARPAGAPSERATLEADDTLAVAGESSGTQLRVYRAAIAATGEYTGFFGGTVTAGLGAIASAVSRINGIFESELSIRFELVANNDLLIYTDPGTDPYTDSDSTALLTQNQQNLDTVILDQNYDIGHVLGLNTSGGLAVAGAGISGDKAKGASGSLRPTGDQFLVNVFAHELGHQFSANHTWNGVNGACSGDQRKPNTSYEPGSGSTILAYTGICGADNLQVIGDPYFHSASFDQIIDYVDTAIPAVGNRIATGNNIPLVDAGNDFTIPAGTPFALTARGSDADVGDQLTYSWEELDLGPPQDVASGDNGESPLFRVWPPTADATRVFPRLAELVNNSTVIGETLPTTTRDMNFRVSVRDNRSDGGAVSSDDIELHVVDTGAAFRVTSPNTGLSYPALSTQTVTWDVAGTSANGIDTANVNILLSSDGGMTFPFALARETPNDGSQGVVLPNLQTGSGRIKVEGAGNVFFDLSDTNFSIAAVQPGIVAIEGDGLINVSESGLTDTYELSFNTTPAGPVVVQVNAGGQLEVSTDQFNFSSSLDLTFNSTTPQVITVRAVDDTEFEGRHFSEVTHTITSTADQANYPLSRPVNSVTARITDNELRPFARLAPLGGLVSFSPENLGTLGGATDIAEFAIESGDGETLSAIIRPDAAVALTVEVVGVSGPVAASTPGATLVLPPTHLPSSGTYVVRVTADGATDFELDLYRNVSLEWEVGDSENGNELNIDSSFTTLGSGRAAVLGLSEADVSTDLQFFQTNRPESFIDISGSANANSLNLRTNENVIITTSVGNSLFPAGLVTVGNNGGIVAGAGGFDVVATNTALPNLLFETALFPLWDFMFGPNPGDVLWEERNVDGVNTLIVQWNQREHFDTPGGNATFQVQVFESGPVFARFAYQDVDFGDPTVDGGASATIGYQASGSSSVQFAFNRARLANGDSLDLAFISPDVDEYEIDLIGKAGNEVDIVLAGLGGAGFSGEQLELFAPDGTTLLATGSSDPLESGTAAANYDLAILGYSVPADGVYTVRLASSLENVEYSLVVTDAMTFDSEPNDDPSEDSLRDLTGTGAALGYLSATDLDDFYEVALSLGRSVTVTTQTLFATASPLNSLDPELEIIHPDGTTVLASDLNSAADGKNATVTFSAPLTGTYRVRVRASSGAGEYQLRLVSDAPPTPQVLLTVDNESIAEAGGVATFTAALSEVTSLPVTIELEVSGTSTPSADYTFSTNQIVIAPGSLFGTVTVTAVQDVLLEPDETVIVEIASVINGIETSDQRRTTTIVDDDGPLSGAAPQPNRNDVLSSLNVSYTFGETVNPGTATDQSFVVHVRQTGRLVGPASVVSQNDRVIVHDPALDFFPGEVVEATVTSDVSTTAGPVAPRVWKFRAAAIGGSGELTDTGQELGARFSLGVALGDLDSDGDLDAFVANYVSQFNRVWLNDGGEFTDTQQSLGSSESTSVSLGDLDGDGDLDAFVSNLSGQGNRVWLNNSGTFTDSGQSLGNHNDLSVALGDVDGDGDLDAFTANYPAQGNHVWVNDGSGRFSDSGQALGSNSSWRVELGDLDLDGDLDAFVINVNQGNRVWLNDGNGQFLDTGQSLGTNVSFGVELGDLDGDGDLDAFVANFRQSNRVWLNDGSGNFDSDGQTLGDHQGYGAALGDLDGDGDLDAFVTNLNESDRLWLNDGEGRFSDSGQSLGDHASAHVALGDLDSDGDLDAFVANFGQSNRVWLNEDRDPVIPEVRLTVDNPTIPETDGAASFTVTLSEPTIVPVTVNLETSGTATRNVDYTTTTTQVVIPPGATSGNFTVTAIQDAIDEPDETIVIDITGVIGGTEADIQQQTTTIVDDDPPPSFAVTSFTSTESGFRIEFTDELDSSQLNLYDTQNSALGQADLVVTGAATGLIGGSLIIETSAITFVQGGGPLLSDTYTVNLRSAADGFVDAAARLLDGNRDGIGGDDYGTSFTVAESTARVISIPDFVRGAGQPVNLPADDLAGIPIAISDGSDVRGGNLRIAYNPALLEIVGATTPVGGAVTLDTTTTPGIAALTFNNESSLPAGSGPLIYLQANVPTSAAYRGVQRLDLHAVTIHDDDGNDLAAIADDAIHFATYFADVSGNARINASDAARVAQFAALLDNGFSASLTVDPILLGDISGNGRINAGDASRVAQFAALLTVPEIPAIPAGVQFAAHSLAPSGDPVSAVVPPNAGAALPKSSLQPNLPRNRRVENDETDFSSAKKSVSDRIRRAPTHLEVDKWVREFAVFALADEVSSPALEEVLDELFSGWTGG